MGMNSKELTSAFDLHHTFLHLLRLSGFKKKIKFVPVLPDRASLFVPIREWNISRNCESLNIYSGSCVCNSLLEGEVSRSPYVLGRMAQALEVRLNEMVSSANYTQICAKWTVHAGKIISAQLLREEVNGTLIYWSEPLPHLAPHHLKPKLKYDGRNPTGYFAKLLERFIA